MRILLLKVLFLCFLQSNSQNIEWVKLFCTTYNVLPYDVEYDLSGNVYSGGRLTGTIDFDPGPGTANYTDIDNKGDGYIVKLDKNGNYKWAIQLEGTDLTQVQQIQYDQKSSIYVSGIFGGTVDFNPSGSATYTMTSVFFYEGFLAKYDTSGNFIWAKQLGGDPNESDNLIVRGNNIYVAGSCAGLRDFDPGPATYTISPLAGSFITKLDTSGNFVWAVEFTGSGGLKSIDLDAAGNLYIGADFNSNVDLDPSPTQYTTGVGFGYYFVKINSAGQFLWAKSIQKSIGQVESLKIFGNTMKIVGTYQYNTDFDPGSGIYNLPYTLFLDVFLLNLDTSGNFLWAKQINGVKNVTTSDFKIDNSGNWYISGDINDTTFFNPGFSNFNLTPSGGSLSKSPFLAIYDNNGNFKKAGKLTSNNWTTIYSIKSSGSEAYLIGSAPDTTNYSLFSSTSYTVSCGSNGSVYIEKLNGILNSVIDINETDNLIEIFPNPSAGLFNVSINDYNEFQNCLASQNGIIIYDAFGKLVLKKDLQSMSQIIDLSHYSSGCYFVKIGYHYKKIIKE